MTWKNHGSACAAEGGCVVLLSHEERAVEKGTRVSKNCTIGRISVCPVEEQASGKISTRPSSWMHSARLELTGIIDAIPYVV